jgi:hypothetical protein
MNRQQQEVIQRLRVENQILPEKLGRKRPIFNEVRKHRLAAAGMKLAHSVSLADGGKVLPGFNEVPPAPGTTSY